MGPLDVLFHLAGFVMPALVLGVLMAGCARILIRKASTAPSWWWQVAINTVVGVFVLLAGLVFLERDGKMLTYTALVLSCASSQWWLVRGWKA